MGADGWVTIYRASELEEIYNGLYPDNDIWTDWTYPVVKEEYRWRNAFFDAIDGERYVILYEDTGGRESSISSQHNFAINDDEEVMWIPENTDYWIRERLDHPYSGDHKYDKCFPPQWRVLNAFFRCSFKQKVEVWT